MFVRVVGVIFDLHEPDRNGRDIHLAIDSEECAPAWWHILNLDAQDFAKAHENQPLSIKSAATSGALVMSARCSGFCSTSLM